MLESRGINDVNSMQRTILSIALGLIFNISAAPAWALNLGKGVLGSTLGQPLNFSVDVNSEPEEGITPECVSAEVYSGDNKLAPGSVRISSDGAVGATQFSVRVSTTAVIDEPVVTVAVSLGCPTRVTRRFILFVDPPVVTTSAEVPASEGFRPLPLPLPAPSAVTATRSISQPAVPKARRSPSANRPAAASSESVYRPQRRIATPVPALQENAPPKPMLQRPPALAKVAAPAASAPRLKLDSAPRVVTPPAASASSAAMLSEAAAAKAAAESASASAATGALQEAELRAARRVAALEESLLKLKAEAQASRKSLETLQATVRDADARKAPSVLAWGLGALAAGLAAVIASLLWLQARRRRNPSWWTGGAAEPHPSADGRSLSVDTRSSRSMTHAGEPGFSASPFAASQRDSFTVASGPAPLTSSAPTARSGLNSVNSVKSVSSVSSFASGFGASTATAVAVNAAKGSADNDFTALGSPRELSVEELIDLEQQADFFVVLGQDEAAIDLLMTHLRSTGGLSPMPYMKLLEIYRRMGNHDAYERIRDRFKQRFNGDIPGASVDPEEGRSITDYPDTLGQLIAVWPSSFKAVETLGRWLARSDSDAPGGSLAFDLPAYTELLFLHSIARDLSAREPSAGGIDVLLPLAMEQPSPISSLHATLPVEPPSLLADSGYDLDLDLSLPMPLPPVPAVPLVPANTKQTDYDNSGPKSDFMSLNIDSRFQG